jgi:diaminopimelate epimerase
MSERVPVAKYHGTGNDFVVVDAAARVPDRRAFARTHCDRETGVTPTDGEARRGADGVLFCAVEDRYDPPRVVMTIVQPDGSTAAMCGNGARCAAAWAMERTGTDRVMLDTLAGTRRASAVAEGVAVEMGDPGFAPDVVPLAGDEPLIEAPADDLVGEVAAGYAVTAVNTGVPHAVVFAEDVDAVPLARLGPALRHADAFPEGANVTVAAAREDGGFDARTYERGVEGETRACGTGAVAVAAVAEHLGRLPEEPVAVHPPGGELRVALPADGSPTLRGPVSAEYERRVAVPAARSVGARDGPAVTDD